MKQKIAAIICLIGLWFMAAPNTVVLAETNVKDCIENDDCEQTDPAETEQEKSAEEPETGSLAVNLVKMVLALGLVLALIYSLLKLLQKRSKRFKNIKALQNIGGVSVGANKSVQLIRIGSRVFLVGVGENVQFLQELHEEDVQEDLGSSDHTDNHQGTNDWLNGPQSKNERAQTGDPSHHFKDLFSNELKKLKQNRHLLLKQSQQKDDHNE